MTGRALSQEAGELGSKSLWEVLKYSFCSPMDLLFLIHENEQVRKLAPQSQTALRTQSIFFSYGLTHVLLVVIYTHSSASILTRAGDEAFTS